MYIILPIPYGLSGSGLSRLSRQILIKALESWTNSFTNVRMGTQVALSSFLFDELEITLRKNIISSYPTPSKAEQIQVLDLGRVRTEEELVLQLCQKAGRMQCQGLMVFAEATHLIALRPMFEEYFDFGCPTEFRQFHGTFESNHHWITARSPKIWRWRNLWTAFCFRERLTFRKKLRKFFRP